MQYTLAAVVNNLPLNSDIFDSTEDAEAAQTAMLENWGIKSEIKPYDSEPADDGYDFDRYY